MKTCAPDSPCPCGRRDGAGKAVRAYADCCGRWLEGADPDAGARPPDAHSLMRSRYTAYVLERAHYLLQSWEEAHRPAQMAFEPGLRWLGLEVRACQTTGAHTATVEFVARCKPARGAAVRLHERSRFVCQDGHWLYLEGDAL